MFLAGGLLLSSLQFDFGSLASEEVLAGSTSQGVPANQMLRTSAPRAPVIPKKATLKMTTRCYALMQRLLHYVIVDV